MKVAPDEFDSLTPEERHQFYKTLRLKVVANLHGSFEVSGACEQSLDLEGLRLCTSEASRLTYSQSTKRPELAFPCFAR